MKKKVRHCPNCGAPVTLALGETETACPFCASSLHFVPSKEELTVVKTREEMKYRERVAARKMAMQKQLDQEEAERWRQTAAKVAVAALPVVGDSAGRALFNAALRRGGGCLGCGCLILLLLIAGAGYAFYYFLG